MAMLYHVHSQYEVRGEMHAEHYLEGELQSADDLRRDLAGHRLGQVNPALPSCFWTRWTKQGGDQLVLPPAAVADVAAAHDDAVLAGIAACAKAVGGYVVFWEA